MRRITYLSLALLPAALAAQDYTVAYTRFGPANADIFLADPDGYNAHLLEALNVR